MTIKIQRCLSFLCHCHHSTGPQANLMLRIFEFIFCFRFLFFFLSSVGRKAFLCYDILFSLFIQYNFQLLLCVMVVSCLLEILVNVFVSTVACKRLWNFNEGGEIDERGFLIRREALNWVRDESLPGGVGSYIECEACSFSVPELAISWQSLPNLRGVLFL